VIKKLSLECFDESTQLLSGGTYQHFIRKDGINRFKTLLLLLCEPGKSFKKLFQNTFITKFEEIL
jgi:hypothetical protein